MGYGYNLSTEERIRKAKVMLQSINPFWTYLSLYMSFEEDKYKILENMGHKTMGVDPTGKCYYNKAWVDKLTDDELLGVLVHELNHLAFEHLLREGKRNHDIFNVSADIVVNSLLSKNGFKLPKGGIIPDYKNEVELKTSKGKIIVKDCNNKTAEQVYDEIYSQVPEREVMGLGFDVHFEGKTKQKENKDGDGKGGGIEIKELTPQQKAELEKEWKEIVTEGAKMLGKVPLGMERLVEQPHKEEIDWKTLLHQHITKQLPYNYTWSRPSKKSRATDVYTPDVEKEKLDVVVALDVSGSIGQNEMEDFISEVVGMAKAYRERLSIKVYSHDIEAHDCGLIENGNIEKIKHIKLKGGGGTSHVDIFNTIAEKERECKLAIFLTDGYSDLDEIKFNKYPYEKLFVLTRSSTDNWTKGKDAVVIKLKDNTR